MNVPSLGFFAFSVLVAALSAFAGTFRRKRLVFAVANVGFVLSFTRDPLALVPLTVFLAAGFAAIGLLAARQRRAVFALVLLTFLFAFFWLKRYVFLPHGIFLPFDYLTVGFSYVFFRVLSLVIDAYQRSLPEPVGPIDYVNYTLNFTSFVSGPIQFYGDFLRTYRDAPATLDAPVAIVAIERIILGCFKVGVLSPLLLAGHDTLWSGAEANSGAATIGRAAFAISLFTIYLYVNFSGYMDVVVGVARFLRLELPENFRRPFDSEGFIEFWGRWHMTLSNWLKTYVFSPFLLASMRRYPSRKVEPYLGVAAFFVTFFLVGVWHGPTSEFLFYGALQGLGVSANKLYQIVLTKQLGRQRYRALCANAWYAAASRALTISYFSITLIWFWSTWTEISGVFLPMGAALPAVAFAVFAIAMPAIALLRWVESIVDRRTSQSGRLTPYVRTAWSTALAAVTFSATVLLDAPAPHIVYKAF